MGRTEADRKITSEPWPSMQRRKKTEKNEREKLFSVTRGSVLKKSLTEPTLLEMSGYRGGLNGSTQHLLEVYSQESRILGSFSVVHSSAARPGRAALASSQTGRCLGGSIAVTADWCFRSYPVARDFADRRSRPLHSWSR